MSDKLPIGTKIRFPKAIIDPVTSTRQTVLTYAREGDTGEIVGYDAKEGYRVNSTSCNLPGEWFGAAREEFEILATP